MSRKQLITRSQHWETVARQGPLSLRAYHTAMMPQQIKLLPFSCFLEIKGTYPVDMGILGFLSKETKDFSSCPSMFSAKTSSAVSGAQAWGLSLRARLTQTTHVSAETAALRSSDCPHCPCSRHVIVRWEICKDLMTTEGWSPC